MHMKGLKEKRVGAVPRKPGRQAVRSAKRLTTSDLGWSRERAREVRARLATFAVDWDDPRMDVYNEA